MDARRDRSNYLLAPTINATTLSLGNTTYALPPLDVGFQVVIVCLGLVLLLLQLLVTVAVSRIARKHDTFIFFLSEVGLLFFLCPPTHKYIAF